MNATDVRDMTTEEIQAKISESQEELFRLRFRGATQQIENPALIKTLRRDVARMRTILRERELSGKKS
jgi:large subunit ribosomal protein L29